MALWAIEYKRACNRENRFHPPEGIDYLQPVEFARKFSTPADAMAFVEKSPIGHLWGVVQVCEGDQYELPTPSGPPRPRRPRRPRRPQLPRT